MRRLLIDFAGIGDLVMLTPFMRQLAREGELDLLTRPWGKFLSGQPFVRYVHSLRKPNVSKGLRLLLFGPERMRFGREVLAKREYDEVVLFRQERPVVREWVNGWKGKATTREPDLAPMPGERSMTTASLHALESAGFGLEGFDPIPRLFVSEEALANARRRLAALGGRVIFLHPGSSDTRRSLRRKPHLKGLRPQQWAALVSKLLESGACDAVVLSGTAPEGREARAIRARVREPRAVHDWTGRIALEELTPLLAAAHALLSIDTGVAHIAAALGTPLLDIFGPTDPSIYLPRGIGPIEMILGSAPCQFCHGTALWKSCRKNVCLSGITEESLHDAWLRLASRIEGRFSTLGPGAAELRLPT